MARLNWTPQTIKDLDDIGTYISHNSFKYGKIQIKRIRERARQLMKQPLSGAKVLN